MRAASPRAMSADETEAQIDPPRGRQSPARSPTRRRPCARAASSPCRPRRSTALPPTPPRIKPSRPSTPPRSGRRSTRSSPMFSTSRRRASTAVFGPEAERLARAFWPGPLTLVLPAAPVCRVSLLARAGLDTVALRSPADETARALIEAAGVPLAAPSANRSGRVSPTTAAHVLADLDGRVDWILDGGPCRYGLESTIVAVVAGRIALLRPGAIAREAIESALGSPIESSGGSTAAPTAPGQLASHYAPNAELRLGAAKAHADEAALDFGGLLAASAAGARLDLSPRMRPRRGGVASLRLFAGARRGRRGADRGRADPRTWARGGDQRPAPAGGRAAHRMTRGQRTECEHCFSPMWSGRTHAGG